MRFLSVLIIVSNNLTSIRGHQFLLESGLCLVFLEPYTVPTTPKPRRKTEYPILTSIVYCHQNFQLSLLFIYFVHMTQNQKLAMESLLKFFVLNHLASAFFFFFSFFLLGVNLIDTCKRGSSLVLLWQLSS